MGDFYKRVYKKIYDATVRFLARFTSKKKVGNGVVVVTKYDGIGDFILFLDCAKGLRELFKDKKLVLTCPPNVEKMALSSGYFDEIVAFKKRDFEYRKLLKVKKRAKLLKCEKLLSVSFSRDFIAEVLTSFIQADEKISVNYTCVYGPKNKAWTDSLYDTFLDIPLNEMCIEQNKQILHKIGYTDFKSSFPVLNKTSGQNVFVPDNYYVLFLGGSAVIKKWPTENYVEIARYIEENTSLKCVIAGTEAENYQEEIFSQSGLKYYSYIGKTTLEELQYLIENAAFVLGNDTSAVHMAAAVGVKSLCVSSAAAGNRFFPYKADIERKEIAPICIKEDVPCAGCSFSGATFLACFRGKSIKEGTKKCVADVKKEKVLEQVKILLENYKL